MDKPHICTLTPAKGQPLARFVFAHGAGAGMDSDFMFEVANLLAEQGIEVWRFNFPYMQLMSESGNRRPPNRMPVLLDEFLANVEQQDTALPLFIGGKSMGGRASTMLTSEADFRDKVKDKVKGVIVMGYPFHPSGKPDKLRIEHLAEMICPCLIIQGDRDAMGSQQEIAGYDLPDSLEVNFLTDGEHSFKPRKASGVTLQDNLNTAVEQTSAFIRKHS